MGAVGAKNFAGAHSASKFITSKKPWFICLYSHRFQLLMLLHNQLIILL